MGSYLDHLRTVDLPAWQSRRGDWYTVMLFDLLAKADLSNREKLRKVYPAEVAVFEEWKEGTPIPEWMQDADALVDQYNRAKEGA